MNGFGAGNPSNEVALLVGGCPQPFAPLGFASSVAGSLMALSWSAAPGATSYVLEAGSAPGLSNLFVGAIGPATSLVAPSVPAGSYAMRVRTQGPCGVSTPSATVTAIVP